MSLNSCYRQKKEVKNDSVIFLDEKTIKKEFEPILQDFIEQLDKEQSEKEIIAIICYAVFDKECILMINEIGYNPVLLKGYANYKNSLLCYYGIEDSIAGRILNLEKLNKDLPGEEYINIKNINDVVYFEPIGEYYLIESSGEITPYEPSIEIRKEIRKLNIKYGFSLPIPPSPK